MDAWFIVIYGIAIGEQNGINIIRNQTDVDMINLLLKIAESINFTYYQNQVYGKMNKI